MIQRECRWKVATVVTAVSWIDYKHDHVTQLLTATPDTYLTAWGDARRVQRGRVSSSNLNRVHVSHWYLLKQNSSFLLASTESGFSVSYLNRFRASHSYFNSLCFLPVSKHSMGVLARIPTEVGFLAHIATESLVSNQCPGLLLVSKCWFQAHPSRVRVSGLHVNRIGVSHSFLNRVQVSDFYPNNVRVSWSYINSAGFRLVSQKSSGFLHSTSQLLYTVASTWHTAGLLQ